MLRRLPIIIYFSFLLTLIIPNAVAQSVDTTMILGSKEKVATQIDSLLEFTNTTTDWDLGTWILGTTTAIPEQYGPGHPYGSDAFQIMFVKSQSQIMSGGETCAFFQVTKLFDKDKQPMYRYLEGLSCTYPGDVYSLEITMVDEGVRLSPEEQMKLYEEEMKKKQLEEEAGPSEDI